MIDIDLLAPVRPGRAAAWARAWVLVCACSVWVMPLATVAALLCVQIALARAERRLDVALARARTAGSRVEGAAQRVRSLEKQEARLRSTEQALTTWRARARLGPTPALAVLSDALPADVWLERLHVQRAEITIQGRGRALSSLIALADELSALPLFDGPIDLTDVGQSRPPPASAPPAAAREPSSGPSTGADRSDFTFTLQGRLRPTQAHTRSTGR